MNSLVRIGTAVNKIKVGNTDFIFENISDLLEMYDENPVDILVFPSLAITSPSCGILFNNRVLLENAKEMIENICILTQKSDSFIIIGTPLEDNGNVISAIAVLHKGAIIGYVKGQNDSLNALSDNISDNILPSTTVFLMGKLKFCILSCNPLFLMEHMENIAKTGCDLVIVPSYSSVMAGYKKDVENVVKSVSKTYGISVCVVNGGLGDTSSPFIYRGFSFVFECGKKLLDNTFDNQDIKMCDIDVDIINSQKKTLGQDLPFYRAPLAKGKHKLLRPMLMNPYLPENLSEQNDYLSELFYLQCVSLKSRLENTGIKNIVVNFSGGLDSTLALLVATKTMDMLNLSRKNILALLLPSFGTSTKTYENSLELTKLLGVDFKEISIEDAVSNHLEDIGHDGVTEDITYENAQARERTQILFDIANQNKALALGTGDLSEIALGWCTFGGDHLSGYNVNASITKTVAKKIVEQIAMNDIFEGAAQILFDIVSTPISPELIGSGDKITQKTEDILGPYELHEFFLYHLLQYGFRPSKIYYYACFAFSGILEPQFIKDKLELFLKRFFSSQFKRSTASDCAIICEGAFDNKFYIPSDIDGKIYIDELNKASFK